GGEPIGILRVQGLDRGGLRQGQDVRGQARGRQDDLLVARGPLRGLLDLLALLGLPGRPLARLGQERRPSARAWASGSPRPRKDWRLPSKSTATSRMRTTRPSPMIVAPATTGGSPVTAGSSALMTTSCWP